MHDLAEMLCQDKLVLRVRTANDEVAHLQDFEYGKSWALGNLRKEGQNESGMLTAAMCVQLSPMGRASLTSVCVKLMPSLRLRSASGKG